MIKVSVVIATLNEGKNLPRCLDALSQFDEVIVFDSGSSDDTLYIARAYGAQVEAFQWNSLYPKKRQYFLDNIKTKHDYIFFVDADEVVPPDLVQEISALDFECAGYFVKGRYCWRGKSLQYGLHNNKLALFDRNKIEFPIIDDLGDFCMGEMEGHYQPVLKQGCRHEPIGQLNNPLDHFASGEEDWARRHTRYAKWEAGMIQANTYPKEDSKVRDVLKYIFRRVPCRGEIAFLHSYIGKLGILDGSAGFSFALSRRRYYKMVGLAVSS